MSNEGRPHSILMQDPGPSRRDFLTRAGIMAGGMALLEYPVYTSCSPMPPLHAHCIGGTFARSRWSMVKPSPSDRPKEAFRKPT